MPKKPTITNRPCIVQSLLNLCSQGRLKEAVDTLDIVSRKGLHLNSRDFSFLLQHCAAARSLQQGKWVHMYMSYTGLKHPNTVLCNHLINMYFKCGDEIRACKVFDQMSVRNLYSWNNMLSGYAKLGMVKPVLNLFDTMPERDVVSWNTVVIALSKCGCCSEALKFYSDFRRADIGFNEFSFAGVLTVCVKLKELALVRQLHCQVLIVGFLSNVVLSTAIVDAYAKCGEMMDARRFFDVMIVKDVRAWTALVAGYAKFGDMVSASRLFYQMPEKNPVSWTALIAGYARNGMGHEALELFTKMNRFGITPDQFTFSSCLCACASIASLKHGKQIHLWLIKTSFRPNTIVVSSLIDMYSKCGSVGVGRRVFDLMGNKQDEVLWNTMMSALAQHGLGEEALHMLSDMIKAGVKPNRITFVVILNACSHSGLLQEGLGFFESMAHDHGIVPDQEHYACLIDLLGRAGHFNEVMTQLKKMPFEPDSRVWNALLGVCRIHGNIELGREAAENLIKLEPQSSAAYVLLSSIYAVLGKWDSVQKVRKLMNERRVWKERAISWVEIENKMHTFSVSDNLHPSNEEIHLVLKQLADQLEDDASSTLL